MINIKTDSRKVNQGDIFIALRTIEGDGHLYIDKAIANGASKIIAEKGEYSVPYEIVEDTRVYLSNYLKESYKKIIDEMNIIAITGTNGKTTIAFLLHIALNLLKSKSAYMGTVGFYIMDKIGGVDNTTPEITEIYENIISSYENGCKNIVLEISSQGISQQRTLGLEYDYSLFTNLTQDHLDYHITMENYALAKQNIFINLKQSGIALVNGDDLYKDYFLLDKNNNITYGFNNCDYKVIDYKMTALGTDFSFEYKEKTYNAFTKLLGKYNVYNVIAVISLLHEMGFNMQDILNVVSTLKAPLGRLETIKYKTNSIIIDYAHTPDAISNVINTVREAVKGDIYVVFGCTGDRDRTKRPLMAKLVTDNVKYAIITNDDPHNEDPNQIVNDMIDGLENKNYEICIDRRQAIIKGINLLKQNDVLLVLGKGHEDVMVIKDKKIPFNDKNEVLTYLEKIGNHCNQ